MQATVTQDIGVAGPRWNDATRVLSFGSVNSREGKRRRLLLIARGSHCKEVRFRLIDVAPKMVHVELGETTPIGNGLATQTTLWIEIPKGSPSASYLGPEPSAMGEITLGTNYPQIPQLHIRVAFAVSE